MGADLHPSVTRPHRLWSVAVTAASVVAAAALYGAVAYQTEASRPVGEGTLFADDARRAVADADASHGLADDVLVRTIRNDLGVAAVSLVDSSGTIEASSAPARVGSRLDGLLATGFSNEWFVAIAQPTQVPITIDGVVEWELGDVLYDVYQPRLGAGGLILSYDVSELLSRRARRSGVQTPTVVMGGVGIALAALACLLAFGRAGAHRRLENSQAQHRLLIEHNRELGEARAEAERALALAEETNRIRSEFVLMINHELRTPLTSVVTGAELLHDLWGSMAEPERVTLLDGVISDGRRLSGLIGQMLTLARIENQGLAYVTRPTQVGSLVEDLQAAAPRVGIRGEVGDAVVDTDPEGLVLLLCSLADNAFTHGADTVTVSVDDSLPFTPVAEVGTRPPAGRYFLVSDNGPGIASGFIDRAFEKFEKSSRASGTGLGLYLARMMVEAIGGSISVETGRHGTTMAVGIPLVVDRVGSGASV